MSNSDQQQPNNFNYNASTGAALLFAALFGITLLVHVVQAWKGRCRYLIPLLIATTLQSAGYVFRYLAIKQPTKSLPIILSQVFIIVSPAFLAANEYMIVGRIIGYVGAEHSFIKPTIITKLFVGLDVLTILSQAGGASVLSGNDLNSIRIGRLILIAALVAQVSSFAVFLLVAIVFDIRTRRRLGSQVAVLHPLMKAFYFSAALIIIRSIYRTIEFSLTKISGDSESGYVVTHEWLFYVFDSILILAATVAFNVIHPSAYIPSRKGIRMDGTTYEVPSSWAWCCCCCCGSRRKRVARSERTDSRIELKSARGPYGDLA